MKANILLKLVFALFFLVLTACIPISHAASVPTNIPATTPQALNPQPAVREAQVKSVEVQYSKTEPLLIWAIVRGNLSELCAALTDPQTSYADNIFKIKVLTLSPTDRGCIQITTPYEQAIALSTARLTPGVVTVIANGVSTTFDYPADNEQSPISLQLVVRDADGISTGR